MQKAKPITKVAVILTPQEAVVIKKLREFDFGELLIKKREGKPYQVLASQSTLVRYEEGLELKEGLAIPEDSELASKEIVSLDDIAKLFTKENGKKEK
jgi:hypothetical protein